MNNDEITEMISVLSKQIVTASKESYVDYDDTFVSVVKAMNSDNSYDILDNYGNVRTVSIGIPFLLLSEGQRVYVTVPQGDISKAYISGIYLQTNRGLPNQGTFALSAEQIGGAPIYHASNSNIYGIGDASKYGHVKLSASTSSSSGEGNGIAATPSAVKTVKDIMDAHIAINGISTGSTEPSSPSNNFIWMGGE